MGIYFKNGVAVLFILLASATFGQKKAINQRDAQGRRNGLWKKTYKNSEQVRYEGRFDHGQEVGTFKFYRPDSKDHPAATKTYSQDSDTIAVKFFTKKGFLITKGQMIGKKRVGEWMYYRKNPKKQVMVTEHYADGKLNGLQTVYFKNGKVTEEKMFKNGLKNGSYKIYAKNGQLLQHYHYKNDTLQGYSKVYDRAGHLLSEGPYKNGLRDGKWRFYTGGKLDSIQKYPVKEMVQNIPKKEED